ncbi:MAG TPA: glutamate racemase [Flavobacteriales bacterium]|nr:glutamate racemase [Flavobacteriales bacterium]
MKNSPIGIFDSGIGGLTVAHALKEQMPDESIIYFGDTKHLPYGEKSEEAIINFSTTISKFLLDQNCKAIVIACNSASSVAYDKINEICGNIPVFNVIDPIVKHVNNHCNQSIIGVIGTKATIQSNIYENKIISENKKQKVFSLATPLLAPMIEEGFINEEISKTIIRNYLNNSTLENINSLILACTHYPLIQEEINYFYKDKVNVIDSANIVAKDISEDLKKMNLLSDTKKSEYLFYVSNFTSSFEKSARFFFQEEIQLKEINPH